MIISLLTYNVWYSRALNNFHKLLEQCRPDIVCLQEIQTDNGEPSAIEQYGYKLADFSNSFIKFGKVYGLATFYNPKKLDFHESSSLPLPRSYYEFILAFLRGGNKPRTVLKTEFIIKKSGKTIAAYNLHLSPTGTNGIRTKQIKAALEDIHISDRNPVVIAGDFNYPYQRKQFEEIIGNYSLKEATNNIQSTYEERFLKIFPIKLKNDYILYKNLNLLKTEKMLCRDSDHFPIISEFEV